MSTTIRTVGIIGAGTMGNGIAQACATSGIDVVMVDISDAAVQKGVATVAGSLDRLIKKDKIKPPTRTQPWPASPPAPTTPRWPPRNW